MILIFKIKTLGKHHTSTHAYVYAGKEFAWFQRNEKVKYYLYSFLDQ